MSQPRLGTAAPRAMWSRRGVLECDLKCFVFTAYSPLPLGAPYLHWPCAAGWTIKCDTVQCVLALKCQKAWTTVLVCSIVFYHRVMLWSTVFYCVLSCYAVVFMLICRRHRDPRPVWEFNSQATGAVLHFVRIYKKHCCWNLTSNNCCFYFTILRIPTRCTLENQINITIAIPKFSSWGCWPFKFHLLFFFLEGLLTFQIWCFSLSFFGGSPPFLQD